MKHTIFFLLIVVMAGVVIAGDLWIPAAAHAPGSRQTLWMTDFYLLNLSPGACDVSMNFIAKGLDQSGANLGRAPSSFTVPASGQAQVLDVLNAHFGVENDSGSLLLSGDCDLMLTSRTYTPNRDGKPGTYGQYIGGYDPEGLGGSFSLIGAVSSSDFRTNMGFVNTSRDLTSTCTFSFRASDNTLLKQASEDFPPFVYHQYVDLFATFGITPQADVTVDVTCSEATVLGYLSTVDNKTGDPIYIGGME